MSVYVHQYYLYLSEIACVNYFWFQMVILFNISMWGDVFTEFHILEKRSVALFTSCSLWIFSGHLTAHFHDITILSGQMSEGDKESQPNFWNLSSSDKNK